MDITRKLISEARVAAELVIRIAREDFLKKFEGEVNNGTSNLRGAEGREPGVDSGEDLRGPEDVRGLVPGQRGGVGPQAG